MILITGCANSTRENNVNREITSAAVSASNHAEASSVLPASGSDSPNQIKQQSTIIKIDMVTIDSGYAISKDFHILKTSDGGKIWTDLLTIPSLFSYSDGPALFALNDNTVSVAMYTATGIEVEKSMDGGKTWSKSAIQMQVDDFHTGYGGSLVLNMINPSDGFLLTSAPPTAGLMEKALYRTSDGGKSWSLTGGNLAGISGYTTGMAFSDTATGYITCTYHGQKEISIYKTADSGKSWSSASTHSLPLPQKYVSSTYDKNYYVDAYPPVFFGRENQNAKMELYFCHDQDRDAYLYSSENGGAVWRIVGISNRLIKQYSFVDDENGFGLDENGTLFTTENGGIRWSVAS